MASNIKLKNNIETEFSIEHKDNAPAKSIDTDDLTYTRATVADMEAISNPQDGDVCFVKDLDRGGSFIYDSSEVGNDNQGTNFNGWIRQYSGAVNVKWFGVVGNGDETVIFQNTLDKFSGSTTYIDLDGLTITTSDTITFNQQYIIANNATISCSNNSVVALVITGGAFYTNIQGRLNVTRETPWASGDEIAGAYGIKINCRVNIDTIVSTGHYTDGINFNASSNMNKSTYNLVWTYGNRGHGCYFDGTQDDMSVWQINMRCQSNYKSGVYFEDTSTARQFKGHIYTEDNAEDTTSYGCYLGGLSSSELFIYSEEQTSNLEIYLPSAGGNNKIYTSRANADENVQSTSTLISGSRIQHQGTVGSTITDNFVNLTNNGDKFWDKIKSTSDGSLFQERYRGDGLKINAVEKADNTHFSEVLQYPTGIVFKRYNGSIDTPTAITTNDTIEFYFSGNTGTDRNTTTNFGGIKVTPTSVGGGNKGVAKMEFGVANSSSVSTYYLELLNNGTFRPKTDNAQLLGSSTLRWSNVYSEGFTTGGLSGVSGSFTTTDGKTITVTNGIVTSIV